MTFAHIIVYSLGCHSSINNFNSMEDYLLSMWDSHARTMATSKWNVAMQVGTYTSLHARLDIGSCHYTHHLSMLNMPS